MPHRAWHQYGPGKKTLLVRNNEEINKITRNKLSWGYSGNPLLTGSGCYFLPACLLFNFLGLSFVSKYNLYVHAVSILKPGRVGSSLCEPARDCKQPKVDRPIKLSIKRLKLLSWKASFWGNSMDWLDELELAQPVTVRTLAVQYSR